jgi:CRP-like cAMP-binding protein
MIKLNRKLERYAPLSEPEKEFLAASVVRVTNFERGATIAKEGSVPQESCLILEGFVARSKVLADGTRQIMAFHIPGDFCDLHSFVLPKMDHDLEALTKCRIGKVPHARIEEITNNFPNLTRALWWDLAIDAAIHREWMISMGRRSAYEQIAHLLCEMLLRLRIIGLADGNSYEFPLTQQELGDAFGLSTVHVNRTLQALRRGNLIVFQGKRISIPDVEALKEAAAFDPSYLEASGRGVT